VSPAYLREDGLPYLAYLVHGEDSGLVSQAVTALLKELESLDGSGALPLEEYGEVGRGAPEETEIFALGPVLDACRTPPFLADRRIVVVRDVAVLDAGQIRELTDYLADPVETSALVLVSPAKRAQAALLKAVEATGLVVNTEPGSGARARSAWFAEQVKQAPIRPDREAVEILEEHLGQDLSRLEGLLETLRSVYGTNATVGADELAPFLGTAGAVAPWDLTDAIDSGSTEAAITALSRFLGAGMRSPFQVLAVLHRHFGAMLRLDGAGITDKAAAASATGLSEYPAQKALAASRRLGHAKLARAITLLADADVALRGESGWPDEVVMEVLVARLARLSNGQSATRAPLRRARRR